MAVRCATSKALTAINSIGFNQDNTCVLAATPKGIKIFSTESYHLVRDLDLEPINIAAMLYCTGFLAFTGTGEKSSPRQITIYNSVTRSVIKTLSLPTTVLSIQLNRQYMAVVLELKTMIYSIGENVDLLCTIPTPSNPRGIVALSLPSSSSSGNNKVFLAVPGGVDHSKGVIHVHDVSSQTGEGSVLEIEAHRTPLGLLTWSPDGTMLASASVKGTVVRVFDGKQGTKLLTLRRGTTPTRITSMEFSNPTTRGTPPLLLVASDRGSVHIFKLIDNSARNPITRMKSMTRSLFLAMRHKTPTSCGVKIAKIKLPCSLGTAAVITSFRPSSSSSSSEEEEEDDLKIQIATGEGILYQYSITEWKEKDVAQTVAEGQWFLLEIANSGREKFKGKDVVYFERMLITSV